MCWGALGGGSWGRAGGAHQQRRRQASPGECAGERWAGEAGAVRAVLTSNADGKQVQASVLGSTGRGKLGPCGRCSPATLTAGRSRQAQQGNLGLKWVLRRREGNHSGAGGKLPQGSSTRMATTHSWGPPPLPRRARRASRSESPCSPRLAPMRPAAPAAPPSPPPARSPQAKVRLPAFASRSRRAPLPRPAFLSRRLPLQTAVLLPTCRPPAPRLAPLAGGASSGARRVRCDAQAGPPAAATPLRPRRPASWRSPAPAPTPSPRAPCPAATAPRAAAPPPAPTRRWGWAPPGGPPRRSARRWARLPRLQRRSVKVRLLLLAGLSVHRRCASDSDTTSPAGLFAGIQTLGLLTPGATCRHADEQQRRAGRPAPPVGRQPTQPHRGRRGAPLLPQPLGPGQRRRRRRWDSPRGGDDGGAAVGGRRRQRMAQPCAADGGAARAAGGAGRGAAGQGVRGRVHGAAAADGRGAGRHHPPSRCGAHLLRAGGAGRRSFGSGLLLSGADVRYDGGTASISNESLAAEHRHGEPLLLAPAGRAGVTKSLTFDPSLPATLTSRLVLRVVRVHTPTSIMDQ